MITEKAIEAFKANRAFRLDNTEVKVFEGLTSLYLYGNEIARKSRDIIYITTAGGHSAVTKERLNGIPGISVVTKARKLYLNGVAWDGCWRSI